MRICDEAVLKLDGLKDELDALAPRLRMRPNTNARINHMREIVAQLDPA